MLLENIFIYTQIYCHPSSTVQISCEGISFIIGVKRHSNLHYAEVNKSPELIQCSWRTERLSAFLLLILV